VEANSTGGQGSRRAVAPSDDDDDDDNELRPGRSGASRNLRKSELSTHTVNYMCLNTAVQSKPKLQHTKLR
jgi:hypothetical protein